MQIVYTRRVLPGMVCSGDGGRWGAAGCNRPVMPGSGTRQAQYICRYEGWGSHLSFSLENEGAVYSFSFFDVEEQLDIGYAHREQPIIGISKAVITESNSRESEWGWRCKLPPSDYASLYNLLQPYVDGEMVG